MKIAAISICLFTFCILSLTVNNMNKFGYNFSDGFWRVVWAIDEGTIWAPGFDEEKFQMISVGMTPGQVLEILGHPLNTIPECDNLCFWNYTKQDSGTSDFDQRWLVFKSGRVSEIRKSFFID